MVKHCPSLCRRGRDYGIVSERELAHFLRGLMKFIYPAHSIPAEYEIAALLKNVDREYADVDSNMYRLHFGQYFRFDISTQLPSFYKSVQKSVSRYMSRIERIVAAYVAPAFELDSL